MIITTELLLRVYPIVYMKLYQQVQIIKIVTKSFKWLVNKTGLPKEYLTAMNSLNK